MFVTTTQVKAALAALMKQSAADMADHVDPVVARSTASAFADIQGRLLKRGFTVEQVLAFDRGAELQIDIALYYCIVRLSALEAFDLGAAKALDRRTELDTIQVFVSGEWVRPGEGASGPGTVNTGRPNTVGDNSVFGDSPGDISW